MSVVIQCIRTAEVMFAFVILGLTGYVANWYDADTLTEPPAQVKLMLAGSAITVFSVMYLEAAPRYMANTFHPLAGLSVEVTNAIVHFASFVAFTVFMNQLLFCRGSVCSAAKAAIAFSAAEFVLFGITAAFAARTAFKNGFSMHMPRMGGSSAPSQTAKERELESEA
jgi:hypothetical protein